MKLSDFRLDTETEMEILDNDGEKTGVVIYSKTFATKEWEKAKKKYRIDDSMFLSNDGNKQLIQFRTEPNLDERKAIAELVTDVTGLDDWKFSRDNITELLSDRAYIRIASQLWNHLKTVGNEKESEEKPQGKKPKAG